ncbi:hypothetical protein Calag_0506 [Caldisphaera lagunensis DSM 15908]|uniref:D-aminoacyl-tRNA deacylase n=1 Tax=Caldisphaera lagunensis (strain DSM 15908 / JCM 11604 / ANMR 0165 / IC-154) TaxID=1056495 RepID=L0AB45_CALLD|nr:D-aminoacyl-tRNA deacylase [Caldisphaera lagunensis]AFZ70270.1 hypothetical protein Calag_0506 [Caldisphaera lagunensis DSM 15908]
MVKYAISYSINDMVGKNVINNLLEKLGKININYCEKAVSCYDVNKAKIAGFNEETINFDFLDNVFHEEDFIIVVSKHQSTSNNKTLSIHHTGNPSNEANFGGKPRELSYVNPIITKFIFKNYYKNSRKLSDYSFTFEATHHGPTSLRKPLLFIEIGSTEKEWNDINAVDALSQTLVDVLESDPKENCIPAIGIGSTHYPKKFTDLELNNDYCFGHIFSKYYVDYLDKDLLEQSIKKSIPIARVAIIEKKGIKSETRKKIENILESLNVEVIYV